MQVKHLVTALIDYLIIKDPVQSIQDPTLGLGSRFHECESREMLFKKTREDNLDTIKSHRILLNEFSLMYF